MFSSPNMLSSPWSGIFVVAVVVIPSSRRPKCCHRHGSASRWWWWLPHGLVAQDVAIAMDRHLGGGGGGGPMFSSPKMLPSSWIGISVVVVIVMVQCSRCPRCCHRHGSASRWWWWWWPNVLVAQDVTIVMVRHLGGGGGGAPMLSLPKMLQSPWIGISVVVMVPNSRRPICCHRHGSAYRWWW